MEIFEYAYANNPESGRVAKVHLTQEEAQFILNVGLNFLMAQGVAKFRQDVDGVDISALLNSETEGNA